MALRSLAQSPAANDLFPPIAASEQDYIRLAENPAFHDVVQALRRFRQGLLEGAEGSADSERQEFVAMARGVKQAIERINTAEQAALRRASANSKKPDNPPNGWPGSEE